MAMVLPKIGPLWRLTGTRNYGVRCVFSQFQAPWLTPRSVTSTVIGGARRISSSSVLKSATDNEASKEVCLVFCHWPNSSDRGLITGFTSRR